MCATRSASANLRSLWRSAATIRFSFWSREYPSISFLSTSAAYPKNVGSCGDRSRIARCRLSIWRTPITSRPTMSGTAHVYALVNSGVSIRVSRKGCSRSIGSRFSNASRTSSSSIDARRRSTPHTSTQWISSSIRYQRTTLTPPMTSATARSMLSIVFSRPGTALSLFIIWMTSWRLALSAASLARRSSIGLARSGGDGGVAWLTGTSGAHARRIRRRPPSSSGCSARGSHTA